MNEINNGRANVNLQSAVDKRFNESNSFVT